jgi:hypothetical protein
LEECSKMTLQQKKLVYYIVDWTIFLYKKKCALRHTIRVEEESLLDFSILLSFLKVLDVSFLLNPRTSNPIATCHNIKRQRWDKDLLFNLILTKKRNWVWKS